MKLISTLIFLLCVTFAFAECYDNHFDECRIERQNGKYGIVIDKQLAIPYEYDEIVPQHNCFFKVRKGRKYGIISYFYEEHKRDGRFPKEIDRPIALKKGYAWLYLSLACEYDKIEEYENQYLQISRDDRKGIVNYYGTLVLPCRFEKIELSNNFFWVSSEGLYGIYNRYGSTIIPCRYNQIELTDRCFYVCRDRLKGVYNRYGSVIIPCQFSQIECKDNAYYVTKGKYQGIYNLYGSVIVPTQYTSIYKEGGKYLVENDSLKGIVNTYGSTVIPCKYNTIEYEDGVYYVSAGGKYAELILANGQKVDLHEGMEMKLRERSSNIQVKGNVVYYEENKDSVTVEEYNMIRTPLGGEYSLTLADGTKVWLNAMSELRYPVAFGEGVREVELKGEAYFEVAKDAKKPFTVQFMSSSVTVLGTSFNIRAYPEEKQSQATLAEGSVRIYSPGSSMLLKPGEQAEVNALSGEMVKREVEVKSFTSWKDGRFVFEQQPLEDIMRTLERWYDIRVIFKDEGAKRISLSGNMKRYGDFSQVMKMLQMTGDVRFELHGNDVYITTE